MTEANFWRRRSRLFAVMRNFFTDREYLEVETPILVATPGCEVYLDYFATQWQNHRGDKSDLFLRSSPELHMKQILAQGEKRIFQFAKSFRNGGEYSDWHHPEFTMLEWYTVGQTFAEMIDQTWELIKTVLAAFNHNAEIPEKLKIMTVQEAFKEFVGIDCIDSDPDLGSKASHAGVVSTGSKDDFETAFSKTLLEKVEPGLAKMGYVGLIDFPSSQAALARIEGDIAKRFEIYGHGIELCNGFDEVTNFAENKARFAEVVNRRRSLDVAQHLEDSKFLDALSSGLPRCCGNALGVDRLLALACEQRNLARTIPFRSHWPTSDEP